MEEMKTTLGLDMGTNSIGWALIKHNEERRPSGIIGSGVRIFQEAVDAKTRVPKNQARRAARSARKLVARRKRRLNKVLNLLVHAGLLPEDATEREAVFADTILFDPYILRKRALDKKLEPFELGRVFYHLAHRRGFLSNRKVSSKDDGLVKNSITSLRHEMEEACSRTLGEYLASQPSKRKRYTDRAMYEQEFGLIWEEQRKYHPDRLGTPFKVALHRAIFFQRPLKLQKNFVGRCTFEPTRKRASRGTLEAQHCRILQDLNNLDIRNPSTGEYRSLSGDEKRKLFRALEKQKTLSWGKARKLLGLHEGEAFNLEEGKKKQLIGSRTACDIRSVIGARWDEMSADEKNSIVTDMLTIDSEQGFLTRMTSFWGIDVETAEGLAKIELEPGYARLSRKAMCKIMPFLEEGKKYDEACVAARYNHSSPRMKKRGELLALPPYLRNPVVQKALYEVRKVVNGVIRLYGKPEVIRLEMARDMKLTRKRKAEVQKEQRAREQANDAARDILRAEFGMQYPTRADIQKYHMWKECGMVCPYTGVAISGEMLFSSEVDVEHILPYSQTLDDSYMNKTLCLAAENRAVKHNRTPFEAYGGNEARYEEILQRVRCLPYRKRRRFEQKEVDTDKFVERQLNDTRYICTEVKKYLEELGTAVEVSKGTATAVLRRNWQLNGVLSPDGSGEKNRADHRHHAVDAVVVALTSKGLFKKLSRLSATSGLAPGERGFPLDNPWPSFFRDVYGKIEYIIVSHAPCRKISGALHEDTAYGYNKEENCFVYRKPLHSLSLGEVNKIRDFKVSELVKARLAECQNNIKKAFGDETNPLLHMDGKTPIKSVRLAVNIKRSTVHGIKGSDGLPYKFFKYGNNHHVEILENVHTEKRKGEFVTALEAAKRARKEKSAIVRRDHGPDWRFLMSLCINDIVEIEEDGVKRYYRVQMLDGSNEKIILRNHLAATLEDTEMRLIKNPNTLRCKKVRVGPLGRVFPCND